MRVSKSTVQIVRMHLSYCPIMETVLLRPNGLHSTKWLFLTGLKILGTDRVGLINDVTKIISEELKVNMSSMSIHTDTGIFEGEIMLYVNDTRHLEQLIERLRGVEGVEKVSRFDSKE